MRWWFWFVGVGMVAVLALGSWWLPALARRTSVGGQSPIVETSEATVTHTAADSVSSPTPSPTPQTIGVASPGVEDRPSATIAFVRDGDIYLLDPATGSESRLTTDGANREPWWTADGETLFFEKPSQTWRWQRQTGVEQVRHGLWSPTGDAIAFSEPESGSSLERAVWVERDGQRTLVTPTEAGIQWGAAAWSPNGQRLALIRRRPPAPEERGPGGVIAPTEATLWVTEGDLLAGQLRQVPLPAASGGEAGVPDFVQWSPDGRFLAVGVGPAIPCASCRADGLPIHVIPVDGGPPVALDSSLVSLAAPSWAPNGSFVVMSAPGGRETYRDKRVIRFDPLTGASVRLADDLRYADVEPAVSPDGQLIAFARGWAQVDGKPRGPVAPDLPVNVATIASRRLWFMGTDGSQPRQLLDAPEWTDEAPRWTSDGEWIVFVRWRPPWPDQPSTAELWAARSDGSNAQRLVADIGNGIDSGFGYYGAFDWLELFAVAPR